MINNISTKQVNMSLKSKFILLQWNNINSLIHGGKESVQPGRRRSKAREQLVKQANACWALKTRIRARRQVRPHFPHSGAHQRVREW